MADLIKLTDNYAYDDYRISGLDSTTIDASGATWIVSNWGSDVNRYPVLVDKSDSVSLVGGSITGEVPLDLERKDIYVNSAAIFLRDSDNSTIQNWTIKGGSWDGIRVRGADDFVIDRVWMDQVRDDAIENDDGSSGTISNSLFDNVFVGLSTADANTSNKSSNVVTFDNVLIRMKNFLHDGEMTHQSPFKVTSVSPAMKIYNSIIAIENVDHIGQGRLETAWEKTIDASGNYFLNLSDKPLPKGYPMPPKGFTVLQGAEARKFWEAARSEWIAEFNGEDPSDGLEDVTPPAVTDPDTGDGADPDSGTDAGQPAKAMAIWLIDAATDSRVMKLANGAVIDPSLIGSGKYNIEVVVDPSLKAGSVGLQLGGGKTQIENNAPYALFGDKHGNFRGVDLPEGPQTLTVTAYSGERGSGTVLQKKTTSFEFGETDGATAPSGKFETHFNVGPNAEFASDGTIFKAAAPVMSGSYVFRDKNLSISGTDDDAIYDSYAFGKSFNFAIDVPDDAVYRVELHLAETWHADAGERVFDVALEGKVPAAFDDIDIIELAGGRNTATTISAEVAVTDGTLNIDVETMVDNGLINGISVYETGLL